MVIDPNNPTGAVYPAPVRRALIDFAERYDLTILADEVYGDLGYEGPIPFRAISIPTHRSSRSRVSLKAYLAPGWRAGWLVVGRSPRLDDALAAIKKLADGRLCSPGPMQYAVAAALTGDRSHQVTFRAALAERARITTERLNAIPGMRVWHRGGVLCASICVTAARPHRRTLRAHAAARDGDFCVNGSGFGVPAGTASFASCFSRTRPTWNRSMGTSPRSRASTRSRVIARCIGDHATTRQPARADSIRARERDRDHRARVAAVSGTRHAVLIYVAGLIAVGLSPLVDAIEQQRLISASASRAGRQSSVYVVLFTVVALFVMLMVPPLAAQARDFMAAAPDLLSRGQQWLIQQGILSREITIGEAVRQAPGAGDRRRRRHVLVAIWGFVGGVFGVAF